MSGTFDPKPESQKQSVPELSPDLFAQAKDAFLKVVKMGLDEQDEYLLSEFGDQPEVREMVLRLLKAAKKPLPYESLAEDLLVAHLQAQEDTDDASAPAGGSRIGPYRLIERLGEGGFGVVYLAEQEEPVRRQVALKVIKLGMDTAQVIARFEAERQALALMEHPGITKVFDTGTTVTGRSYFVMELVRGISITKYCDEQRLSITDRLKLFQRVCDALHHAHQKGVIHRDIKPSNILVTEIDGEPVPKIIDFGIAKATSTPLSQKTIYTEFRQLIGTPEYMSPEQATHSAAKLDSRSDVYSLGVLLYELLTGTTPFDSKRLRSAAYGEMQRIIREEDPQRPSTRLSQTGTIATIADTRSISPGKLNLMLAGDLDWVIMRCLEKAPGRRYDSVAEVGREIGRYMTGNPVEAVPPSRVYLLQKWLRRHRRAAVVCVLLIFIFLLGLVGTTAGFINAHRQQNIAYAEAENAERQTYVAQMQLAWSALGEKPGRASEYVEDAPEAQRGWEWSVLRSRLDLSYRRLAMPWPKGFILNPGNSVQSTVPHPDGESVFFTYTHGENYIEQRDLSTGEILLEIPRLTQAADGARPLRAQLSDDGSKYYLMLKPVIDRQSPSGDDGRHIINLQVWDVGLGTISEEVMFQVPLAANQIMYHGPSRRIVYSVGAMVYSKPIGDARPDLNSPELPYDISGIGFSPDNMKLFVNGGRGPACILSMDDLSVQTQLLGHTNLIRGIDFSDDSATLITASLDGTARIWDLRTFSPESRVINVGVPLSHAWLSHDGRYAITEAGSIRVWDAISGQPRGTLAAESMVTSASFELPGSNIFASRDIDGAIRFWHMDSMSTVELNGHQGHVNAARFTGPTGYIVSAGWDGWRSNVAGCIRIWDASTGLHLAALGEPGEVGRSVEVTSDGRYAVCLTTQGHERDLRVIDLVSGATRSIPGPVLSFVVHPGLPYVAVSNRTEIQLIRLSTGELLRSVSSPQGATDIKMLWLNSDSEWGKLFVQVLSDQVPRFVVLDVSSGRQIGSVPGRYLIHDHRGGDLFVFQEEEGLLHTYNSDSLTRIQSSPLNGVRAGRLKLDTNGELIASSVPDDQAIMLWDAETLNRVAVFSGDGYVSDLSWSEDGKRLIATWDEQIVILDDESIGARASVRSALQAALGMVDETKAMRLIDPAQRQAVQERALVIRSMLSGLEE